jgi:uncharacterized protein (TIGR03083 family)
MAGLGAPASALLGVRHNASLPGHGAARGFRAYHAWVPIPSPEPVIDQLDAVWNSTLEACAGLSETAWDLPTECPGWTVRDQLSHLIGIERMLLGDAAPALEGPVPEYVHNAIGEMNEAWIAARRALPGGEVLAEFAAVTKRRLDELRTFAPERFDVVGPSPIGEVPYRRFMVTRVFDSWVHEQDARRALERPGGLGGPGEALTLDQIGAAMPYVLGKLVAAPDGTSVVWDVHGTLPRLVTVSIENGRGSLRDEAPARPTVRFTLGSASYWRLGCGRVSANRALASEPVTIAGDEVLGQRILEHMNFMF